jgi:hypothetical protein
MNAIFDDPEHEDQEKSGWLVTVEFVRALTDEVGENSRNGNLCTLRLGLLYFWESKRPKTSRGDSLIGVQHVVSSQIEMLPAQRRQMF